MSLAQDYVESLLVTQDHVHVTLGDVSMMAYASDGKMLAARNGGDFYFIKWENISELIVHKEEDVQVGDVVSSTPPSPTAIDDSFLEADKVKDKDTLNRFKEFLKEHGVSWEEYVNNCSKYPLALGTENTLTNTPPQHWACGMFSWYQTQRGSEEWELISDTWEGILRTCSAL